MSNLSTQELMDELKSKIILNLNDNETPCSKCNGLQFIYVQEGEIGYIKNCNRCYNGKQYICNHCGKSNKTDRCDCKKAEQERRDIFNNKESERDKELFDKATKIKFNDYEGKFILPNSDFIQDSDGVYEWLYNEIKCQEKSYRELPKYLWSTKAESVFNLELKEIISDKCDDGYEDMYSNLDTNDEDLIKAQEYIDKWYEKQGDMVNTYYEDYTCAVLLDDLIEESRKDIEKENK